MFRSVAGVCWVGRGGVRSRGGCHASNGGCRSVLAERCDVFFSESNLEKHVCVCACSLLYSKCQQPVVRLYFLTSYLCVRTVSGGLNAPTTRFGSSGTADFAGGET